MTNKQQKEKHKCNHVDNTLNVNALTTEQKAHICRLNFLKRPTISYFYTCQSHTLDSKTKMLKVKVQKKMQYGNRNPMRIRVVILIKYTK